MKRHPVDLFSLGAGVIFLALALGFLLAPVLDLQVNGAVAFPMVLVGLGLFGLVAAVRGQRTADSRQAVPGSTP